MFLDLNQLAETATPPLQGFFRLAEAAIDGAEQLTQASLDATRDVVEAGRASLLLANSWGSWHQDALALQASRRQQAVEKAATHYRRMLGLGSAQETGGAATRAPKDSGAGSGAALAALQAVWLETASAFGSLQYCPVMRLQEKSTS